MNRLVVVGQGYVGLPMALRAVQRGFEVVGLDTNHATVEALSSGRSHIDDVSNGELSRALEAGFRVTTDTRCIAEADVVVVCVPTPLSEDGGPDLRPVRAAAEAIGEHIEAGTLVVLESTTYPGTTEEIFAPLVTARKGFIPGVDISIAFSPERIDPGNETYGVANTPKVVGGLTSSCTRAASAFYSRFVDTVVEAKGAREAEMAKLIENTFRHVNIALVNEMVRFCHELDIDLWDAIDCAATKPFGYMPFRPGPGVGGHCIPVDPSYLSHRVKAQLGYAFRMVELAEEINTAAPLYVAARARGLLNERSKAVKGSRILIVGVTYKADISDLRESPAVPLARRLADWGAELAYHDPFVAQWRPFGDPGPVLSSVTNLEHEASLADVVILLQPHAGYDLAALAAASDVLLDTRAAAPPGPSVVRL